MPLPRAYGQGARAAAALLRQHSADQPGPPPRGATSGGPPVELQAPARVTAERAPHAGGAAATAAGPALRAAASQRPGAACPDGGLPHWRLPPMPMPKQGPHGLALAPRPARGPRPGLPGQAPPVTDALLDDLVGSAVAGLLTKSELGAAMTRRAHSVPPEHWLRIAAA
jgi:hypothetical protein